MPSSFRTFIAALRRDLLAPLPGRAAQYRMAPQPRPGAEHGDDPAPDARRSGVLILFYPHAGEIYFPLILRPTYRGVHSGQVSLPGGRQEPEDADLTVTALREAQEEIGVPPASVEVVGALSTLYIAPSNSLVQPVVGCMRARPVFAPDPYEVALLIEAPLKDFLNPANYRTETWEFPNRQASVPIYGVQNQIIWGATAMILGELLELPVFLRMRGVAQV
jgi:8-oxo-dGTP pyrophosphatase MutT (NUDIX family)